MIVLAGGIGSGKSVVARTLRLEGYGVFDCDFEASGIMHRNEAVKASLRHICGEDIYDGDGLLRRSLMASRLFSSPGLRAEVNCIVHEAVKDRIKEWLEEDSRNVFVETAIAAESGIARKAEEVWIVTAETEERVRRVKARDGRNEEAVRKIMEAQQHEEELVRQQCASVREIDNNPDSGLLSQIENCLRAAGLK